MREPKSQARTIFLTILFVFVFQSCSTDNYTKEQASSKETALAKAEVNIRLARVGPLSQDTSFIRASGSCDYKIYESVTISWKIIKNCGKNSCEDPVTYLGTTGVKCINGSFYSTVNFDEDERNNLESEFLVDIEATITPVQKGAQIKEKSQTSIIYEQRVSGDSLSLPPSDISTGAIGPEILTQPVSIREIRGTTPQGSLSIEVKNNGQSISYQWRRHNGNISVAVMGRTRSVYENPAEGSYSVVVTSENTIVQSDIVMVKRTSLPYVCLRKPGDIKQANQVHGFAYDPDLPGRNVHLRIYLGTSPPFSLGEKKCLRTDEDKASCAGYYKLSEDADAHINYINSAGGFATTRSDYKEDPKSFANRRFGWTGNHIFESVIPREDARLRLSEVKKYVYAVDNLLTDVVVEAHDHDAAICQLNPPPIPVVPGPCENCAKYDSTYPSICISVVNIMGCSVPSP